MLSLAGALGRLRIDDGQSGRLSPSATLKAVGGLLLIVLTSVSTNWAFTIVMLAALLVRVALLPQRALARTAATAFAAAGLSVLIMIPAILLGQSASAVRVGSKVLVSVSIVMCVTLSTTPSELTGALRTLHVPNLAIMTLELAFKGIVDLGHVALEVLCALKLRSVGKNRDKGSSIGGVGGVTLLKSAEASRATSEAMRCRGFEGEYAPAGRTAPKPVDAAWCAILVLCVILFVYLEGVA